MGRKSEKQKLDDWLALDKNVRGIRHPTMQANDGFGWGNFGPNFERPKKKFQPRCLIIGSLTSPQGFINGRGYYYASPTNYFWKLLTEAEEHHLAFGQWHGALFKGTKKQIRASISKIKKGLDKCGIILCDILASAAVKDVNKAPDDGIVLFDQDHPESPGIQTVYYDQLIKEVINEYQIHFVFYNGGLTKRCLDKKGLKTCENYQVIRLISPAARKAFVDIEKDWSKAFSSLLATPVTKFPSK